MSIHLSEGWTPTWSWWQCQCCDSWAALSCVWELLEKTSCHATAAWKGRQRSYRHRMLRKKSKHLNTLESEQIMSLCSYATYSFKSHSPIATLQNKTQSYTYTERKIMSVTSCVKLTHSPALPLLMCYFAQLAKSYFYEGSMAKKLSSNHLLIQHMPPSLVSGKRQAPYLHCPSHSSRAPSLSPSSTLTVTAWQPWITSISLHHTSQF